MYGLYFSGFASLRATMVILLLTGCIMVCAEPVSAAMLVAQGKRNHYVANQEEGTVFAVYGNGEWVRFADGFGHISGLCVCPDGTVCVLSSSQRRLYRIDADGKVRKATKLGIIPQAIYADRDGEIYFVQRNGVVTGVIGKDGPVQP
ncbi:hypothetical protein [Maridesulfovibrio sp. FT414]|uniref:hypothetical protein n=1 Tax=Maridesulfovibrio sp. FT414 TaxID=2979469 RepID=UPI003D803BF8